MRSFTALKRHINWCGLNSLTSPSNIASFNTPMNIDNILIIFYLFLSMMQKIRITRQCQAVYLVQLKEHVGPICHACLLQEMVIFSDRDIGMTESRNCSVVYRQITYTGNLQSLALIARAWKNLNFPRNAKSVCRKASTDASSPLLFPSRYVYTGLYTVYIEGRRQYFNY